MEMLKQSKWSIHRHELAKVINDANISTTEDILDILFGTHDNDYDSDYVIYDRYKPSIKQTMLQRFNTLWVYPLFTALILIRYLLFGEFKINGDSRLGSVTRFFIGEF